MSFWKQVTITIIVLFLNVINILSAQHIEKDGPIVHQEDGSVLLENFEKDSVNNYPSKWYDRDGNDKLIHHSKETLQDYYYKVEQQKDNKFLRYSGKSAKHISLPLVNEDKENIYNINIYDTPILSWKVRAYKLPKNANEKNDGTNDSVASIYVFFDMGRIALFKKVPKTIRYTWSSNLKEGTELSKLFGNQQIYVVKSGTEDTGKWVTFKRNIVKDYQRMFGDKPPKSPIAIILLSDGDSTGSWVKADYDDIMLKPDK